MDENTKPPKAQKVIVKEKKSSPSLSEHRASAKQLNTLIKLTESNNRLAAAIEKQNKIEAKKLLFEAKKFKKLNETKSTES